MELRILVWGFFLSHKHRDTHTHMRRAKQFKRPFASDPSLKSSEHGVANLGPHLGMVKGKTTSVCHCFFEPVGLFPSLSRELVFDPKRCASPELLSNGPAEVLVLEGRASLQPLQEREALEAPLKGG